MFLIHCSSCPGAGPHSSEDVDPSLLESLDDSTSSSDVPKSKLDQVRDVSVQLYNYMTLCMHAHVPLN